jgi:hypothetical protein
MRSHADGSVNIQTTSQSNLATPCWFGQAVLLTAHLRKHGILSKISERVRGCRGGASDAMTHILRNERIMLTPLLKEVRYR